MSEFKEKLEHAVMAAWNGEWPAGKINVKEIMQLIHDECHLDCSSPSLEDPLGRYLGEQFRAAFEKRLKECGGEESWDRMMKNNENMLREAFEALKLANQHLKDEMVILEGKMKKDELETRDAIDLLSESWRAAEKEAKRWKSIASIMEKSQNEKAKLNWKYELEIDALKKDNKRLADTLVKMEGGEFVHEYLMIKRELEKLKGERHE